MHGMAPRHTNTVFSKFDFAGWRVLEHSHHPIDWEAPTHPLAAKEPRKGRRTTLVADVAAPGGAVRVYCSHLEVMRAVH
jgi:endonuclease/exonuclease/phosphatase family metal-dependent hydrolase